MSSPLQIQVISQSNAEYRILCTNCNWTPVKKFPTSGAARDYGKSVHPCAK